jgi:hypothetical protein
MHIHYIKLTASITIKCTKIHHNNYNQWISKHAFVNYLVSPTDEIEVMLLQELLNPVRTKGIGNTPVILTPAVDVFVRVRP